jgi:hypothetical protein
MGLIRFPATYMVLGAQGRPQTLVGLGGTAAMINISTYVPVPGYTIGAIPVVDPF